jgi:hypothetical protein
MRFVSLIVLTLGIAAAQQPEWDNVKRIAKDTEIRVSLFGSNGSDGKSYRGQLQSATDDSLMMVAASSQETLARAQIKKVSTKKKGHRLRNTLIGAGVGVAAGAVIGVASNQDEGFLAIATEVLTPVGAVLGAAIGAAIPTGGWHDVYRVK